MKQSAAVYELFDDKKDQQIDVVMAPSMPLAMACAGEKVHIHFVAGGRGVHQRLASMGLSVGSEIEVIKRGIPGPFLVGFGDTRLAIGTGIAHKIMVSPNKPNKPSRREGRQNDPGSDEARQ